MLLLEAKRQQGGLWKVMDIFGGYKPTSKVWLMYLEDKLQQARCSRCS